MVETKKSKMNKLKITIIEAPSNLGLIEPKPGHEPGVKKLPKWLEKYGLYRNLLPDKILLVEPPAYSMYYADASGVRNADAIAQYSKKLARIVSKELRKNHFPIVIGGDCSILIGCALALKLVGNFGLFFIDGHTDFVLPQSSFTKGAAGMDLAIVTGYGHVKLSNLYEKQPYVTKENVLAFGNKEFEKELVRCIETSGIEYFDINRIRKIGIDTIVNNYLSKMKANRIDGIWIHLDVDVLDDVVMPCVDSPTPGGLRYDELKNTLKTLLRSKLIRGINLTILDPDLDPRGIYTKRFVDEFSDGFLMRKLIK